MSRPTLEGKSRLYSHGTCKLEGVAEAMFFRWEHKPEAPGVEGEGLAQGHSVKWRQSGLCPQTLAGPCPLSLSQSVAPSGRGGDTSVCWVLMHYSYNCWLREQLKGKPSAAL